MISLKNFLLVGLGGFTGAILRYACAVLFVSGSFPRTTLFINIAGSFLIGILFAFAARKVISNDIWLLAATGICGGFTTFSAFSLENMLLLKEGNYAVAAMYIVISIAACIAASFIGFKLFN